MWNSRVNVAALCVSTVGYLLPSPMPANNCALSLCGKAVRAVGRMPMLFRHD